MSGERFTPSQVRQFRRGLLAWYSAHARDLPWRRSHNPYDIWVSEIMLQQTRVNAVLDHYALFMTRFPSIQTLASAEEAEVLAVWSGLGYYRRARMMHKAAKVIANEFSEKMPQTAERLLKLPGIGEYTSAAIASIAFGEPVAVVDGNVERVVMRLTGASGELDGKSIRNIAQTLLDVERPGDANQAMMELGAMVCLPKNPLCLQCPVQKLCRTRGEHPAFARKKMVRKQVSYTLLRKGKGKGRTEVLLEQRSHDATLMAGMWELPQLDEPEAYTERLLFTVRHSITTTNYLVHILQLQPEEETLLPKSKSRRWVRIDHLTDLPLTGLTRKVLKRAHLLPDEATRAFPVKRSAAPRRSSPIAK